MLVPKGVQQLGPKEGLPSEAREQLRAESAILNQVDAVDGEQWNASVIAPLAAAQKQSMGSATRRAGVKNPSGGSSCATKS